MFLSNLQTKKVCVSYVISSNVKKEVGKRVTSIRVTEKKKTRPASASASASRVVADTRRERDVTFSCVLGRVPASTGMRGNAIQSKSKPLHLELSVPAPNLAAGQ